MLNCVEKSGLLWCTILCQVVLHCNVLYCTVICCIIVYCTVLYCTVLYCTVQYCTVHKNSEIRQLSKVANRTIYYIKGSAQVGLKPVMY